MARRTNDRIQKPHLILCEGVDAENFLIRWLESKELSIYSSAFENEIQVMDFGGNEDLPKFLKAIKTYYGYTKVSSLLVIRDAERDAKRAEQSIQSAFMGAGFPAPRHPCSWESDSSLKTGFLLFPSCNSNSQEGTLEDLCLSILKENNNETILQEIQKFLDVLKREHKREFPHEFKSKLHTYFSVTDDFVSLKIGEAAMAGAFDWNHPRLHPLRDFLLELFQTV